jgi:hypothetical protein
LYCIEEVAIKQKQQFKRKQNKLNKLANRVPYYILTVFGILKIFHKTLKNKGFAVVNSNNLLQLCLH